MSLDIAQIYADHEADRFAAHTRHLNEQMVRVLKTLGYDVGFVRGTGQYLFDRNGAKYLDLLSGYGVFAIGRNHPALRDALKSVLDADLPRLVQIDVSPLAGLLAQRLLGYMPYLDKVFFANSGTEAVEAAIKFARGATRRSTIIHCEHSFHGLTYGALSLNGDAVFRTGFEPLLPDCTAVPFNDLAALEQALATRDVAAFIVEPIQGKGVNLPDDDYLREARGALPAPRHAVHRRRDPDRARPHRPFPRRRTLGRRAGHGADRQGALGRPRAGRRGARRKKRIFDKIFDRMDRAVVHGSTFAKNDLAMAAGLATLDVIESERLVAKTAQLGARLHAGLSALIPRYEFLRDVRGKGLMLGIEFGPPQSLKLKASWNLDRIRQQGAVLPAHHHPAVRRAQDPHPGRRPCEPHRQAPAARSSSTTRTATGSSTPSTR